MFDLNLIEKPGLQVKQKNKTISFLKKNDTLKKKNNYNIQKKKPKSRIGLILFFGFTFAIISAIGFLYLLPLVNSKNNLDNLNYNYGITKNEVVSIVIDLLLNKDISPKISEINFKNESILIKFNELLTKEIKLLNQLKFYNINIRTSVNKLNKNVYSFKLPWTGISNPINKGLSEIKEQIGERFVLSNSYDFTSDSFVLIIDNFENIVSILLRLHDSDILDNYQINIHNEPNDFSTIYLKHF
tara:strand:- start:1671 stop:2399 length:729 start_codon:yes stop_codon:yes gene_type:complete